MERLYPLWNVSTRYGTSLPVMERLYPLWNVSTRYGTSLPETQHQSVTSYQ
ncbi:hypothetical protein [Dactylococcopsis salina]|uniref:Uncharacterized protein n=1 Tax=Dactylococcopsis salina (strain PCC 8305) TaxID=13035 RepID=K9YYA1_DACS8|nr:hypothetical protein [Dactylococcopsis salina]AFZ51926.1 hypothetical protein Dacsa_3432 [Dactylococcopsis salina PCC 8305]